jgi:predicted dehydrogenase
MIMRNTRALLILLFIGIQQFCAAQDKLRVVIAGLSHDHVNRILEKGRTGEIVILGVVEPDKALCAKKKADYQIPDSVFYGSLSSALTKHHPDLVMVFNSSVEHLPAIEAGVSRHIPVMVEKPLCFSYADATKIKALSDKYQTKVFTNYPSLWYTSFMEMIKRVSDNGEVPGITKMAMHGGHRGPIEIGCSKEFGAWLTDPLKNGGGAITDFGCYGACIMTQLMNGEEPQVVFATTRHLKPKVYTKVDDDATIVLEYKSATGVIEASWNWPYTIMDAEVYGKNAYLHASQFNGADPVSLRSKNEKETREELISTPKYKDEVEYLTAVLKHGAPDDNKLMSLSRNMTVVKVLDAARRSAKEKKRVVL